jgi:hypothetical protein
MSDGPSQLPILLTFAGVDGREAPTPATPTTMPAEAGQALRAFFEAHPAVEFVQFEIALNENGDDLEFAGGTLHDEGGAPLRDGREARQAGEAFRKLLRGDEHLRALPVRLVVAHEGTEPTYRITRASTGAPQPEGRSADADARASARERARLEAHDARFDQRDELRDEHDNGRGHRGRGSPLPPDDDHVA